MSNTAIVGAGISGLSTAYFLKENGYQGQIDIFDPGEPGGKVQTLRENGFILEEGPETYLVRNPLLFLTAKQEQCESQIVKANPVGKKRFIVREGSPQQVPSGPLSFIASSLIYLPQKIALASAMGKKAAPWEKMSFFDFVKHFAGETNAEYLASPFSRGVYGCEAEDLEFSAAFPQLYANLRSGLSLAASVKKMAADRKEYWFSKFPGYEFTSRERGMYSFADGLATLPKALAKALREKYSVNFVSHKIISVEKRNGQYSLKWNGGSRMYNRVVWAIQAKHLAPAVQKMDELLSSHLSGMRYSPVNVVFHGWDSKIFKPNGFGFLVPRKEKFSIMGTLFSSSLFPGRAIEGQSLTKTMVKGDASVFSDSDLSGMAEESLKRLFTIHGKPLFSKVVRHDPGIPLYFSGYSEWKRELMGLMDQHSGMHITGWDYHGMGIPDALEGGYRLAGAMLEKHA